MIYLTILMAERVGLIIILAFLLVSVPLFRRLLFNQTISAKIQLTILFSIFAFIISLFVINPIVSPAKVTLYTGLYFAHATIVIIAEPIVTIFRVLKTSFVQYLTQLFKIKFTLLLCFFKIRH